MKKSFLLVLILISSCVLFAQDDDSYVYGDTESSAKEIDKTIENKFDWSRVTIGGGLSLSFGTITVVDIAPTIAYYLTDQLIGGVGVNYMYYEDKSVNFQTHTYGARVFSQYLLEVLPILAHVEAEVVNADAYAKPERVNVVNLYVGGGLNQRMGDRSYFYLLMLWNLNENNESIFIQPNPIIRVGIGVGI